MQRVKMLLNVCLALLLVSPPGLFAQSDIGVTETGVDQAIQRGYLLVSGQGVPGERFKHQGQRKLMALRAAQVDAYRQLLESVDKVKVSSESEVKDMAGENDLVRTAISGLVQGAQVIKRDYDVQEEIATVYLRLPITGKGGVIDNLLPQLHQTPPPPNSKPYVPPAPETAPQPHPAAKPIDGLIIDVTSYQAFRPALVNRILTEKGEVLYDPSKIAQDILVQHGSGDYTTDTGKAKAILSERGSQNPLLISASDIVRMTDVQVSAEAATTIFAANQQANFLEAAKVVFVLQ
jgi:hypothetical protein